MNKQEIISILEDFPYSRDEYWIITGSAMVLYGIREQTHDIDMGCTSKMANKNTKKFHYPSCDSVSDMKDPGKT